MFTEAGCTSALLRPALRLAAAWRIAFPEGGASIPFTIENRGDASGAVHARRELRFPGRRRVMVDAVREHRGLVVDALGTSGRLEVALRVDAVDGALVARSSAVRVRVGGLWWRVPRAIRPRVHLVERWDDTVERQHVDVVVTVPSVGQIYGYHGWFEYEVVSERVAEGGEHYE